MPLIELDRLKNRQEPVLLVPRRQWMLLTRALITPRLPKREQRLLPRELFWPNRMLPRVHRQLSKPD